MKRWIIRSFFIAATLLFIAGWLWSYPYREHLAYVPGTGAGPQKCVIEIGGGRIFLGKDWGYSFKYGWIYYHTEKDRFDDLGSAGTRFFGFQFFAEPGFGSFFVFPFWFPTAICAALLWLVWRKTGAREKGRAFPVELKRSETAAK